MMLTPVLIGLTVLSTTAALVLGYWVWRLTAAERRRSDARVALLEAELLKAGTGEAAPASDGPGAVTAHGGAPGLLSGSLPAAPLAASGGEQVGVRDLFGRTDQPPRFPRLAVVGLVGLVGLGAFGVLVLRSPDATARAASASADTAGPVLELQSLGHDRQEETWAVRGLVHSPAGAPTLSGAAATVHFFDKAGTLLASARSPLELPVLRAGEQSAFTIRTNVSGAVARYRVSFQNAEGGLVHHVDGRAQSRAGDER